MRRSMACIFSASTACTCIRWPCFSRMFCTGMGTSSGGQGRAVGQARGVSSARLAKPAVAPLACILRDDTRGRATTVPQQAFGAPGEQLGARHHLTSMVLTTTWCQSRGRRNTQDRPFPGVCQGLQPAPRADCACCRPHLPHGVEGLLQLVQLPVVVLQGVLNAHLAGGGGNKDARAHTHTRHVHGCREGGCCHVAFMSKQQIETLWLLHSALATAGVCSHSWWWRHPVSCWPSHAGRSPRPAPVRPP